MSDLISRQAVIDKMAELQGRAATKTELKGISKAWKRIKKLPSVEPERKKGKWEIYVISMLDGEDCRCSECGKTGCVPYWNYCPNCGADMRGEE